MEKITLRVVKHDKDIEITVNDHNPYGPLSYIKTDNDITRKVIENLVSNYNTLLDKYNDLRDQREDIEKNDLVKKIIMSGNFEHCADYYYRLVYDFDQVQRNLIKPLQEYYESKAKQEGKE